MGENICNVLYDNELLKMFGIDSTRITELLQHNWKEPHRFYHNIDHLAFLLERINLYPQEKVREVLEIVALYHDAIYNPRRDDNEEMSAQLFLNDIKKHSPELDIVARDIYTMIMETKYHNPTTTISTMFCNNDLHFLMYGTLSDLIEIEKKLFKEYQYAGLDEYIKARKKFLKDFIKNYHINVKVIEEHIEYLDKYFRPNIGIYAGSFNPFHKGHLNILEKAEKVFDKVVVAMGINPEKVKEDTAAEFNNAIRLKKVLPFHEVVSYYTTLDQLINKYKAMGYNVTLIRGLRNGYDLEYEQNLIKVLNDISLQQINVAYFLCDGKYEHISSTVIRGLKGFKIDKPEVYTVDKYSYADIPVDTLLYR